MLLRVLKNPRDCVNGGLAVLAALMMTACSMPPQQEVRPAIAYWRPYQTGVASWYRDWRTASGERFNSSKLTAAHRTLRFGTLVRVTNLRNGHWCVVRINDRGPYTKGRVIDVTKAAAKILGLTETGIAQVRLEVPL